MSVLRIYLMGSFTLTWDGAPLPPISGVAARSLLAYLATYRDRTHTRDLLAGTFWPDLPDVVARRRLSQALWQIRRALNPHPVLQTEGNTVQLNPDLPLWIDVEKFIGHNDQCTRGGDEATVHCELCLEHYKGDFLAGYYDDWVVVEQERLREMFLAALEQLVEGYKGQGEYDKALVYGRRLASEDPWREEAHREVMRLCHLLGRGAEALKQFEICCQVLEEELGVEPSAETEALAAEIATRADLSDLPVLPAAARRAAAPLLERPDRLPLVGRRTELADLLYQVEAAARGNGGLTLIYGEAGVGKTRLLRELADNAQWRGIQTVWGRCYELAAPPAYQPLVEALRADLPVLRESALQPLWRAELSRLLPELATGEALPPSLSPEEERRRLLEAIVRAFLILAETSPHLVLLEDAHWIDPASVEALRYLLPRLGDAPLLIVVTVRTEELAGQPATVLDAMESTRLPQRLDLERLDRAEAEELVQRTLGLEQPAPRFSARLYAETEGNPFFLIETLWSLADEGLLYRDDHGIWSTPWDGSTNDYGELPIAAGVVQSIERRLGRLSPPLGELLSLAAVIGRGVDFDLWYEASGRDEEEILRVGDELCAKGLLLPVDPDMNLGGDYAFAHDQIRRVTYERLAAPRRRLCHRQVAQALTHLAPGEPEALAYHWTQAAVWDKSADYHQRAGDGARAVYANAEAVAHYTQALDSMERLLGPPDPNRAFELWLAREDVHALQGDRVAQAEDLAALEALAVTLDHGGEQAAGRRAEVALRRAKYAEATSDYPTAVATSQTAVRLAQSAQEATTGTVDSESARLELARLESARLRSAGYLIWGLALWRQGEYAAARSQLEEALTLAQTKQLRDLEADSLRNLGLVCLNEGDYARAEEYFEQTLRITPEIGDPQGECVALNSLGIVSSSQGHYARARDLYERSLHISREIGDRRSESVALNNLGTVVQYQGDYSGARSYFEQVLRLFREVGDRQSESLALGNLGDVADYQGDYMTARDYYTRSLCILREIGDRQVEGWMLGNLGNVCDSLGAYADARAFHDEALLVLRDVGDRRGEGFVLSNLGLLCHHMGNDQAAREHCQQALHITRDIGDRLNQGYAWTNVGHVQVSLGRLDEAAKAYRRALDLRRELVQKNLAIESQAGLAHVSMVQGNRAQALEHIEAILQYLEADPVLDGTDQPLRVYLTCYRVLCDSEDPRAQGILTTAFNLLQEQAAKIDDKAVKRTFLENVPSHRELIAAYRDQEARQQGCQISVRLPRADAPTGRPLRDDEYVTVSWTVDSSEDEAIVNNTGSEQSQRLARRQYRLLRLLQEATEQGALPTVEDLAAALDVSQPTIKRDLAVLRRAGHKVLTRGSRGG